MAIPHTKTITEFHCGYKINEQMYSHNNVDDIDVDEDGPPEHLWNQTAPSTEETQTRSMVEGSQSLTEVSQKHLNDNADFNNVDVSDGLVNRARGEVVHFVTTADQAVSCILVAFDNDQVGLRSIQSTPHRSTFPCAVPLAKHKVMFRAGGKKGAEVTRVKFPLALAWATNIKG